MTILDPRQFLRVEEKFLPAFALFDDALDTPGLLSVYVALWHFACHRSRPTQVELARCSKCGLRALQSNLSTLCKRGYIALRKEGGRNLYDLVLSPSVVSELLRQGVEYQKSEYSAFYAGHANLAAQQHLADTQILRIGHANSAPPLKDLKSIKKQNTPLSPLPNGPAPDHAGLRIGSLCPASRRKGAGNSLTPTSHTPHPVARNLPPLGADWSESSLSADFATLWAAWPVHQAEAPARRVFASLSRRGILPAVDTLLAVIDHLKAHDFRWREGGRYVPQLSNWLRDERWRDEAIESVANTLVSTSPDALPTPKAEKAEESYAMKEKENLTISPQTLALLASSPWMSKKALDKLQAHCTEISHEQGTHVPEGASGHGQSGISGVSAGYPGHAGKGLFGQHDICGAEKGRQNRHWIQPVLAIYEGKSQCCTSAASASFASKKVGISAYAQT